MYWYQCSRSPCGERGLKCQIRKDIQIACMSLPVRGAWIEISTLVSGRTCQTSRSPCGERGLK